MYICIICSNYPAPQNHKHVFLEKLVKEFIDLGHNCTVIAPQVKGKKGLVRKIEDVYKTEKGNEYHVYSPVYNGYSGRRIGPIHLGVLTYKSFVKAVIKTYEKHKLSCDVFYAHFINAGVAAYEMSKKYNKPFFIANGESDLLDFIRTLPKKTVLDTYKNVSGIISVSTANKYETLESGYYPSNAVEKIHVVPNAINMKTFYQEDRVQARKELKFSEECFIVIFVGSFSNRKGSQRVAEALSGLDDVYSIFIGTGSADPSHENCLYKGKVDNSKIRTYLSAADVFVLPTLNEGCCNAIIEALACGLPVISSDLPFNYDILDDKCSILIDPSNVPEIRNAILNIKNNVSLREAFSKHALEKVKPLGLTARAKTILNIISTSIQTW